MRKQHPNPLLIAISLCLAVLVCHRAHADLLIHYDFSSLGTPVSGANFEVINQGTLASSHNGDGFGGTSIALDPMFGNVAQFGTANGNFIRAGFYGVRSLFRTA